MFRFLQGFGVTLKYFFGKKVTIMYPEEKEIMPQRFRGVQRIIPERCIVCNLCVKACPTEVISLTSEKDETTNKKVLTSYDIEFERCIRCEYCTEVCPTEAVVFTTKYDNLSVFDRKKMKVDMQWLSENKVYGNYTTPEEKAIQDAAKAKAKAEAAAKAEATRAESAKTETKDNVVTSPATAVNANTASKAEATQVEPATLNLENPTKEQLAGAEAKAADQTVNAPGATPEPVPKNPEPSNKEEQGQQGERGGSQ